MFRALFAKAFHDAKLLLAALCVLLCSFAWLQLWASSKISVPALTDFLANAVPKSWEGLSPVKFSDLATPAGRIAITYAHPLILLGALAWSIGRGSDCVSGEIGRGSMEMILAQPVSRRAVFAAQALMAILGAALIALAVWCGTALGLATVELPQQISQTLFIPAAVNVFALMVCLAGLSALASSWENQRWRTVGLMGTLYVVSTVLDVVARLIPACNWLKFASFLTLFSPQTMVAHPDQAWQLWKVRPESTAALGLGGQQLALLAIGLASYCAGAAIFHRRDLPAPL